MAYENIEYNLVMTIVNRGFAELVVDASRDAGATGGTIIFARGTGVMDVAKFMDISIQPEKEIVLTLVRKDEAADIIHAILEVAGLRTDADGISFTLPVTDFVGLSSQSGMAPKD